MKEIVSVVAVILAAYISVPTLTPLKTACVVACDKAFDACLSTCDDTKGCATRCMAKHLECKASCGDTGVRPDAAPLLWYCHGRVFPCKPDGNEDPSTWSWCEHGFGHGPTKPKAVADTIAKCETTLNTNGGPWKCSLSSEIFLNCEQEAKK